MSTQANTSPFALYQGLAPSANTPQNVQNLYQGAQAMLQNLQQNGNTNPNAANDALQAANQYTQAQASSQLQQNYHPVRDVLTRAALMGAIGMMAPRGVPVNPALFAGLGGLAGYQQAQGTKAHIAQMYGNALNQNQGLIDNQIKQNEPYWNNQTGQQAIPFLNQVRNQGIQAGASNFGVDSQQGQQQPAVTPPSMQGLLSTYPTVKPPTMSPNVIGTPPNGNAGQPLQAGAQQMVNPPAPDYGGMKNLQFPTGRMDSGTLSKLMELFSQAQGQGQERGQQALRIGPQNAADLAKANNDNSAANYRNNFEAPHEAAQTNLVNAQQKKVFDDIYMNHQKLGLMRQKLALYAQAVAKMGHGNTSMAGLLEGAYKSGYITKQEYTATLVNKDAALGLLMQDPRFGFTPAAKSDAIKASQAHGGQTIPENSSGAQIPTEPSLDDGVQQ